MPETPSPFQVIVIGGGLGGLCLAQGLVSSGIGVTVYERDASASVRGQGYRISLKSTGARALHDCLPRHLFDLCVATSLRPATRMVFTDTSLTPNFTKPLPGSPPGLAGFGVNRLTLREILLAGLDDHVRFGRTFERYEPLRDGRVRAWFTDGSSAEADLLVGADGTNSAVRAQLLPGAVVEELRWAIYGRTPIAAETLRWVPEVLVDTFNRITRDDVSVAIATCRVSEPVATAAARLAPGLALTEVPSYFQWITPLSEARDTGPATLHRLATATVAGWHPAVQRIIAEADIEATFAVRLTSARRVPPWDVQNVTLLGDAIHTMSPGRGDGANIALRDARLLSRVLGEAAQGARTLADAKRAYETAMLDYGFAAVEQSLRHPFGKRPALAPWDEFAEAHHVGDIVQATVTGTVPIGAFVEIVPGVTGILLGADAEPGSRIPARITEIDDGHRRVKLAPAAPQSLARKGP